MAVSEQPGYPGRRHMQCVAHAVGLWVEKNLVPPPNRRALNWSVVLTVRRLCPIVPQDNIVVSNKHNWPEFYLGNARACPGLEPPMFGLLTIDWPSFLLVCTMLRVVVWRTSITLSFTTPRNNRWDRCVRQGKLAARGERRGMKIESYSV